MTAVAVFQRTEAEGLTLLTADNSTGYKYVTVESRRKAKPYKAQVQRVGGGKNVCLGLFATAEEAALCNARTPEGRAATRKRGLAEADDGEADAFMVEAHELMEGDGDGPWDEDPCVVEAVIVEGAALRLSRKRKIKSSEERVYITNVC